MQIDADLSPDGRWLTYDQLARLRRIDKPSAVKLATRNHWPRRKNNTGQMQVCVPAHWFERAKGRADRYAEKSADTDADISPPTAAFEAALAAIETAHASEVTALREQIARLDLLVETERGRIVAIEAKAAAERQTFREQLAAAQEAAKASSAEVLMLARKVNEAAEAEAARRARGRWARLRSAWRGE